MKKKLFICLIIALVPSIFFIFCVSPSVYWEDSGEFITTAHSLGIAHPPGHPLYVVLAHLFTIHRIPESVAYSVNLFSVFASFFAIYAFSLLLSFLCSVYYRRIDNVIFFLSLFCITLLFAFSRTFWYISEFAEVYSLHILLSIGIIGSLCLLNKKGGISILLFAYLLGLSLTNNITIAFLVPAFMLFLVLEKRNIEKRYILFAVLLFFLGISLYLYIPVRARFNPVFNWGNAYNMKNFIFLITAREFSGGFTSLKYAETSYIPFVLHMLKEISFWGIVPFFFGSYLLFKKKRNLFILFIASIVCNITFSFLTGRGPDFHAYFLPSSMIAFLIIGFGILHILSRAKKYLWFLVPFLFILSLLPLPMNYATNCRRYDYDALGYGTVLLKYLPEDAILLTGNTNDYFILTFLKEIVMKKNVEVLYLPHFKEEWFIESLKSRGFSLSGALTPLSLVRSVHEEVYYTPGPGISLPAQNLLPSGPLFKIVLTEKPLVENHFSLPHPAYEKGKKRYAFFYARFGEFYFSRKEYIFAIEAYEKANQYDEENPAIYHNLSIIYRKMNNFQKATFYEQKARKHGFKE